MGIHYKRIGALAGPTTTGTYGTAINVTMPQTPTGQGHILGVAVVGADATYTAAQGSVSLMRFNSNSLGLSNQVFPIGPYEGSGPATNSGGYHMSPEVIPLDWGYKGTPQITVDIGLRGPSTVAKLFEASIIYDDQLTAIPDNWIQRFPSVTPFRGGDNLTNETLITTTRTAVGASPFIQIPDWASYLCGVKATVEQTGAITANEEILGYVELTTTQQGTDPLEIPTNAFGATLGTPVDMQPQTDPQPWLPLFTPVKNTPTITPYMNLRTAKTGAATLVTTVSLAWR